jgi:hypothetical protein
MTAFGVAAGWLRTPLGIAVSVSLFAAVAAWARNRGNLAKISRAIGTNRRLQIPEMLFGGYDAPYLNGFVAEARAAEVDGGEKALDLYRAPTLLYNDVCFAVALALFLFLVNIAIGHDATLPRFAVWISYVSLIMSVAYAIADIGEDLTLARIFDKTGPVTPDEARLASAFTRLKFLTLALAFVAPLVWLVAWQPIILKILPALVLAPALFYPRFARILWACRVSVVSAFGGYLLFLFVVQAQDLFSDTTYGEHGFSFKHLGYWTLFFVLLFLVWAFPVHYAARESLDSQKNPRFHTRRHPSRDGATGQGGSSGDEFDRTLILWTPRALGAVPIVAVMIGILSAAIQTRHAEVLVPGLALQYFLLLAGALAT